MIPNNNFRRSCYIRLRTLRSLIFFALSFLLSCRQSTQRDIRIIWDDKRAVAIAIPESLLNGAHADFPDDRLKVYVEKNKSVAVLGEQSMEDDKIIFKPIVPLSRGLNYRVYFDNKLIGNINVPPANSSDAQRLLMVYPSLDTLPENLLKLYLRFSGPMQEGESLKHVALVNHNGDTVHNVFLDLQPELWNKERTVLTLWLDPGRIKRDLIPNRELGNPLKKGERYTLKISNGWRDVQGLPLQHPYNKPFIVTGRDGVSPGVEHWQLVLPAAQTKKAFEIKFDEPLDYFLLQESIRIVDKNNKTVAGTIQVSDKERKLQFIPGNDWMVGNYSVQVDPVLEDIAGNNLARPFDRDLQLKHVNSHKTKFELSFQIKQ